MTISFKVSPADCEIIQAIAERAAKQLHGFQDRMHTAMDITACHANGMPLRLQELLDADQFNFSHDVVGIHNHICRDTGKMLRFFVPRFAKGQ